MAIKPRSITPYLWYKAGAEEAAKFYCSLFEDSRITDEMPGWESAPRDGGAPLPVRPDPSAPPLVVNFTLAGQPFIALNGGPQFPHTEAFSIFVLVDTQQQLDELWNKLTANGGEEGQCGWLKDRWGVSWQITPKRLLERLTDKDPEKAKRAMDAMLKMQKIDIATIEKAYAGR